MKTHVIQDEQEQAAAAPAPSGGGGRTVAIVVGAIAVAIGLALVVGGGVGLWALGQRDDDGFFMTESRGLSTPTSALVTENLDVDADAPDWVFGDDLATARIGVSADQPVFVGIAPTGDVRRYLAGTPHSQITDVDVDPFRVTSHVAGSGGRAVAPTRQDFWRVQSSGPGTRTITWPLESGRWSAVIMNADGSPRVDVQARVGARVPSLKWVTIGTLGVGVLFLLVGGGLVYAGTRRPRAAI
jgi:hypothetical protein